MLDALLLHPRSREQVAQYIQTPSHAVLLIGATGMGKGHIARHMAAAAVGVTPDTLASHPYFLHITPDGASISIDTIRELQRFLQLRTLGNDRQIRRVIIVEHAESLTTEAQNAYLKLLEEPPADTVMILTVANQQALLPTILSRTQLVTLHVPPEADITAYFADKTDPQTFRQAYFLSGGLPGLIHALLNKDQTHPLMDGVVQAKVILQKNTFERLAMVESLSKKKDEALYVLEALQHIAQTSINQATTNGDRAKLKQWHHIIKVTFQAYVALRQSANTKLTLTNLMLQL